MEFLEAVTQLMDAPTFKEWKAKNTDSYIAHGVFFEGPNAPWQIGFYNPERDTLSVFEVGSEIVERPEEEAFKEDKVIQGLDLTCVKISFHQALEIMEDRLAFHKETATRRIFIIQHIHDGQVWNNTYVTQSMKTLNVKINALTGEVLGEHLVNVMDMVQQLK